MRSKNIESKVFKPNNFKSPDELGAYLSVLGKHEFEIIAGHIIKTSKEKGKWRPVSKKELCGVSEMIYQEILDYMIECGQLRKVKGGYLLTQGALEQIAKKYHV